MKRYLIITVDTEEEFDWRRHPFSRDGGGVENVKELCHLQQALAELDAKVTYFVDYPVLRDETARDILNEFYQKYGAELGTHLHPWCTPPFKEELSRANTMANMLPEDLVRSKLETLTDSFVEAFGFRPFSYRAGRFGFDSTSARIIGELGYKIDTSVTPFSDWSKSFGPDFFFSPLRPYFIGGESVICENKRGDVLEVPISVGFNRVPFRFWSKIYWYGRHGKLKKLKLVGALDRSHLLKRITLDPELQSVQELKSLIKSLCCEEIQIFNMIFHSSSTMPRGNSLIRTVGDKAAFEKRIIYMVRWALEKLGMESITMSELLKLQESAYLAKG